MIDLIERLRIVAGVGDEAVRPDRETASADMVQLQQREAALAAHVKRFEWRKVKDEQPPADTVLTWRIPLNAGGYCYFTGFQSLESGELCEVPYGDVFTDYEVTDDTQWCYIAADDEHSPKTSLTKRDADVARKAYLQALYDYGVNTEASDCKENADSYAERVKGTIEQEGKQ